MRLSAIERVLPRLIENDNGCWLFEGAKDKDGYGQLTTRSDDGRSKSHRSHRVVWEHVVGLLRPWQVLDHRCPGGPNRACANPAHLAPVTTRENTLLGRGPAALNAVRTTCVNGHPFTPDNTYVRSRKGGGRICKTCIYERAGRTDGPYSKGGDVNGATSLSAS